MNAQWTQEEYVYLEYDVMREKLSNLEKLYPKLMKLDSSASLLNIPHYAQCGERTCVIDIVTLTDHSIKKKDKIQIYLSGTLHGDERIGPNAVYYFIEYMLSNYEVDSTITYLLQNREIIITPMTNAVGYYHNEREERINRNHADYKNNKQRGVFYDYKSYDINRDFPYNQERDIFCLNTIAGRVIHQLFVNNLFVSSLTFHGGTTVIGYPWGSMNHIKSGGLSYTANEAPDYLAFQRIGEIMQGESGNHIKKKAGNVDDYILGDMTSTVYPVRGGLEDWAYGAGWDYGREATDLECNPQTYILRNVNQSQEVYEHIRSAMYLIETANQKIPSEQLLGGREIKRFDDDSFQISASSINAHKDQYYDGYINRNIRLIVALVESSKPYIQIVQVQQQQDDDQKVLIEWKVNGCYLINEAHSIVNGKQDSHISSETKKGLGSCNYYQLTNHEKQHTFKVIVKKTDSILLQAIVDQEFGKSVNEHNVSPKQFKNDPQLHLSKMRTLNNYEYQYNGKQIKSSKVIQQEIKIKDYLYEFGGGFYKLGLADQNRNLQEVPSTKTPNNLEQSETKEETFSLILKQFGSNITGELYFKMMNDSYYALTGKVENLPMKVQVIIKLMEYGDFRSLYTEYPHYNSLGQPLQELMNISPENHYNTVLAFKHLFQLPEGIKRFQDLAGRAVIIIVEQKPIGFGIIGYESQIKNDVFNHPKIGICQRLDDKVYSYLMFMDFKQGRESVEAKGMIRTSRSLPLDTKITGYLSLDYDKYNSFSIEESLSLMKNPDKQLMFTHPCYTLKQPISIKYDLAGKLAQFFVENDNDKVKILQTSQCSIGLKNPFFRVNEESFCLENIEIRDKDQEFKDYLRQQEESKEYYSVHHLINFFFIGFCVGLAIAFCCYLCQFLTWNNDDIDDIRSRRMEFVEIEMHSLPTMLDSERTTRKQSPRVRGYEKK